MNPLPGWLQQAPTAERREFAAAAVAVKLPAGKQILAWREIPGVMAFPVTGAVRVYLVSREGREITLYRIKSGGSCVLTASCILGGAGFPALAEVEKDVLAWAVPAAVFREWVARSEFWRRYVFQLLGDRLAVVLARLEETTFDRVDWRLARLLLASGEEWNGTHQRLAVEVGTAREVVSRILERWRSAGWIETKRGRIKILQPAALQAQTGLIESGQNLSGSVTSSPKAKSASRRV
jgi:CRP/FNR family transcriptional regulator, anaerobic regulatory protein